MSTPPSPSSADDFIIGSDEVGYGSWAGPLVVCAVLTSKGWKGPPGLADSKLLTPAQRVELYTRLYALPFVLVMSTAEAIDHYGVTAALVAAHTLAIKTLLLTFPMANIVVDGNLRLPELPHARSIPKADALFPCVSAASIIAKVNHDHFMALADAQFPGYGFAKNVGYGTALHTAGLQAHGVTPLHRTSYAPIKKILETK